MHEYDLLTEHALRKFGRLSVSIPSPVMAPVQSSTSPQWPQVVKCGELTINIWHHIISGYCGHVPCWTYASYGMSKVNQPNLVITLRRRTSEKEEDYSLEPLNWFKIVYSWGKKGRIIDPYHSQEAHFEHWLGSKKLETVTYGMPIELPGFGFDVLPRDRLHGIALTSDECDIAKAYGYTRVIGHYGLSARWFPYRPWIDRDRDDCFTWAQTEGTLRQRLFPVTKKVRGASARQQGSRIILEFLAGSEDAVEASVPVRTEEVVVFESHLHPNADACYIWEKGNEQMSFYGSSSDHTECIGLCYLGFYPQQTSDYYNVAEDGLNVFLRDQTWLGIRAALKNGHDIVFPLRGDNGYEPATLEVEFLQNRYRYEPTGLELVLKNGVVKKWRSQKAGWLKNSALRLDRIAIADTFGPDPTTNPSIVNFMEQIGEVVSAIVPRKERSFTAKLFSLAFNLPTNSAEDCFNISASPDFEGIDGMEIWKALRNLHPPQVWKPTSVTMFFGVWE